MCQKIKINPNSAGCIYKIVFFYSKSYIKSNNYMYKKHKLPIFLSCFFSVLDVKYRVSGSVNAFEQF